MATTTLYPSAWALPDSGEVLNWETSGINNDRPLIQYNYIAYRFDLPTEKLITEVDVTLQYVIPSQSFSSGRLHTVLANVSADDYSSITSGSSGSMSWNFYSEDSEYIREGTRIYSFTASQLIVQFYGENLRPNRTDAVTIQGPRLTVTYENVPTVTLSGPADNAEIDEDQSIPFSWSVSNGTQASAVLQYRRDGESSWNTLANISGSTSSYTYSGSSLATDLKYNWRVVVTTTSGVTATSGTRSVTKKNYTRITSPANGATFTEGDSITIQWETSYNQVFREIERSTNGGSSWTAIVSLERLSSKSYTDTNPPTGSVAYRVSAGRMASSMAVSKSISVTVNALPNPSVTPGTPWGDVIYADQAILFSWSVSNATQASAYLYYSTNGGSSFTLLTTLGSSTQYTASANTFSAGQIYWKVSITTTNGKSAESSPVSFTVMEPYVPPTPDDPPTVGRPSASVVNSGLHSDFANTAIAGISKCRISASVTKGTNNISRVYFTYPEYSGSVSMTLSNGVWSGETPQALSSSTTFTVTAVDTEGYYDSDTVSVTVQPYAIPAISVNSVIRCDASGAEDGSGQYYKVNAAANCSSVSGKNYIVANSFTAAVKNVSGSGYQLTNNMSVRCPNAVLTNEDAVYVIVISATDHVGRQNSLEVSLAGRVRDVVFKRDTTNNTAHVGVGMAPGGGDKTTFELPPGAKIIIGGQDITAWLRNQIGGSW